MSYTIVGNCPKCGAPIYSPSFHHSILPPPVTYTCGCRPVSAATVTTTTSITVDGKPLGVDVDV
jgi:hypothetical protein